MTFVLITNLLSKLLNFYRKEWILEERNAFSTTTAILLNLLHFRRHT